MAERIEKLRTLLDELEQELRDVEALDDQTRSKLQAAAEEIQTALQEENAHLEHQTVSTRLGEAVSGFESSHPTLHAVVGRIVDVLGQMGI